MIKQDRNLQVVMEAVIVVPSREIENAYLRIDWEQRKI